jgi:hypothetical protein
MRACQPAARCPPSRPLGPVHESGEIFLAAVFDETHTMDVFDLFAAVPLA